MTLDDIIDFNSPSAPAAPCAPRPERLLSGQPRQSVQACYSSPCEQFQAGVWESDVGMWRVAYSEHEYCEMLSGVCSIHDENGMKKVVRAGDRFIIPAGFTGIWEVLEPCRKIYVTHDAGS